MTWNKCFYVFFALLSAAIFAQERDADGREIERLQFGSYAEVMALLERLEYTPEAWQAGIREIPRLFLTDVPPRWREETSREISVQAKKQIFFRMLAPLALRANELIQRDRERLEAIVAASEEEMLTDEDRVWLDALAAQYRVVDSEDEPLPDTAIEQLLLRVDQVPVSLALAQAAEESGWGTSRFAAEGNALFGQWTWGSERITPEEQREGLGDYGIAAFETPLMSLIAYMRNLNTHPAYAELRDGRARMRSAGERLSGRVLAEALTRYSERGAEYVDSLHTIMRVNQLDAADGAYMDEGPSIFLVPASAVSE